MLHCKVLHPEKALAVLANIRPTRKNLAGANAPAYFAAPSAPKKKMLNDFDSRLAQMCVEKTFLKEEYERVGRELMIKDPAQAKVIQVTML